MRKQFIIVITLLFAALSVCFYALCKAMPDYNFVAIEAANFILALLAVVSGYIVTMQMKGRPQAFVRGVTGASFLKMMVCMIGVLIYAVLNKSHIHMPTVIVFLSMYIVYTIAEKLLLSKIARA